MNWLGKMKLAVQISELHEGEIRYPPAPGIKHLICVLPS